MMRKRNGNRMKIIEVRAQLKLVKNFSQICLECLEIQFHKDKGFVWKTKADNFLRFIETLNHARGPKEILH